MISRLRLPLRAPCRRPPAVPVEQGVVTGWRYFIEVAALGKPDAPAGQPRITDSGRSSLSLQASFETASALRSHAGGRYAPLLTFPMREHRAHKKTQPRSKLGFLIRA